MRFFCRTKSPLDRTKAYPSGRPHRFTTLLEGGPRNRIGGYTLYDARVTRTSQKGDWEATVQAANLGDKLYYLNVFDLSAVGAGSVTGTPGEPLDVSLQVKHSL